MKRFLLLFCAVVLVCSTMVVPAFAAESFEVQFVDSLAVSWPFDNAFIPDGEYTITFTSNDVSLTYDSIIPSYSMEEAPDGALYYFWEWVDDESGGNAVQRADLWFAWCVVDGVPIICLGDDDPNGASCSGSFSLLGVDYTDFVLTFEPVPEPISPIEGVLGIFSGISTWIINQLAASTSLFWDATAGSLTFLGILAVASLAFSVILLLIVIIRRFLHFRG